MVPQKPTIDDVLKYEEALIDAVEELIKSNQNSNVRTLILRLQILLKGRAVKTFVNYFNKRQFSLSCFKRIQEIDDALDELRVRNMHLPYPEEFFILEQGKMCRARRNTMITLLCGLFGFEWVE